jgi:L-threonylcarbamoyladenylate synthase
VTARIVADDAIGRAEAIEVLRAGGIVAMPTDTVYGVGVALETPGGIERLFEAKRRPPDRAVMLLLADPAQAGDLGVVTPASRALGDACWPGGLTLVLAQRPDRALPLALTGGATTIGLRVPAHDAPRDFARALGPLPVTSANVSDSPVASDAAGIASALGDAIELILDGGPAGGGPASTVVDCSIARPRILRDGAIPAERLAAILDAAGLPHDVGR